MEQLGQCSTPKRGAGPVKSLIVDMDKHFHPVFRRGLAVTNAALSSWAVTSQPIRI